MEPIDQLMQEVVDTIGDEPGPVRIARQRRAVDRMFQARLSGHGRLWLMVPAVTAAVALLVMWLGREAPREATPVATLERGPFAAGAWLRAEHEPLALDFPDRSRVELAPGSLAQLTRADLARMQLDLEHGRLELRVTPGTARIWLVVAGPYTVEVTGTRFTVDWRPQARVMTVEVSEGSVRVRDGGSGDGSLLTAGQQLRLGASTSTSTQPPSTTALSDGCGTPDCPSHETASSHRVTSGWRELAAQGAHARALMAAEREGLASLINRLSADDLDQLAHSARLARAARPAREALQSLRRRFPAVARAKGTAFLLGRVALELDEDPSVAASWFETYLREQPHGELAEEARARLMTIRRDLGDRTGAEAAARDYLQHHPEGRSAAIARRLIETH
ncbi:FecR family protein [Nannocystis sp. ILAH1]|uniref:FecR family protein n=1 Tax=Nannocystis sp. ILAH1 TaxID=2996789 RepID=UPI00226D5124|nr:FecR family protein [Nannocystis sp. ILAH1]MCY0989383.1 FecR family protein [Nannocystis sp. ILAH1]